MRRETTGGALSFDFGLDGSVEPHDVGGLVEVKAMPAIVGVTL